MTSPAELPNVREVDGDHVYVHLPHNYLATAAYHTLCGLCDVPERISDTNEPVDCETCMRVLNHVLALAAHRGVIQSCPRQTTQDRARIPSTT